MTALLLVALGGAAGSAARAAVAVALPGTPLGATFLVNMLGAFALGVLVEGLAGGARQQQRRQQRRQQGVRLLLGTGFCGGFTTYSAVALHSAELLQGYVAAGYAFATLALGAIATLAGLVVGRLLVGGRLGSPGDRA